MNIMKLLALFVFLLFVAACGAKADPNGTGVPKTDKTLDNYGDEQIGYKNSDAARAAEEEKEDINTGGDPAEDESPGDGSYTDNATSADSSLPMADETVSDENWYPDETVVEEDVADEDIVVPDDDTLLTDEQTHRVKMTTTDPILENPFFETATVDRSTFSIDVDTGSYSLVRGYLKNGELPPAASVRIEEMINYFHLRYKQPTGDIPFNLYTELSSCPWNPKHKLMMLGIQGQEIALADQPPANLVFLIDVSGSMTWSENKLPLLKKAFRMMASQMRDIDRVAIVSYAGNEALVLDSTPGSDKETIYAAIDNLEGGGSTNGSGGIQLAYEVATENFLVEGNNRVILATDGDFNVGITDQNELVDFIATKRDTGVFLSVYGFGEAWDGGNYRDEQLEQLADNGNGIYFYIDGPEEARRAFLNGLSGSLLTIAKDVKLQVAFNKNKVKAYRLIGYENRVLDNGDFNNDLVDAGELGAGLSVTAFYEIIPADSKETIPDPLPGTVEEPDTDAEMSDDDTVIDEAPVTGDTFVNIRIRYKEPDADTSELLEHPLTADDINRALPSLKFLFAAGVTEFSMLLRHSQYLPTRDIDELLSLATAALPADAEGAVTEFINLVELAKDHLDGQP